MAEIGSRESRWSLQGMTALVTGGTKGIGFSSLLSLPTTLFLVSVFCFKYYSNYCIFLKDN
jgi:hypothetical protein